jgi:hypothetical protein
VFCFFGFSIWLQEKTVTDSSNFYVFYSQTAVVITFFVIIAFVLSKKVEPKMEIADFFTGFSTTKGTKHISVVEYFKPFKTTRREGDDFYL